MPNITTCNACGALYEAGSDEQANEQERLCGLCENDPSRRILFAILRELRGLREDLRIGLGSVRAAASSPRKPYDDGGAGW